MSLFLKLTIFFAYTLIISLLLHRFFVIRAEKYQIKKVNITAERWSTQTKPILGGITFYVIFLFSLINYTLFFGYENLLHAPILGAIIVINISFLMGLADDMLNTPPGFKFLIQIIGAIILIYFNLYIQVFNVPFYNYALTIFWFVGIMNSINMLDNMDAITTSVSSTILIGSIVLLSITQHYNGIMLMVCLGILAALLSFLYYNWHPSKMYMGDNGSQFLGSVLAIVGIEMFWNAPVAEGFSVMYPFLLAFLAFLVPISDTTTVTINRIMRGQSPFIGGRDHTTHHLSYFGLSDAAVARILLTINGLAVAVSVLLIIYRDKLNFPLWIIGIGGVFVLVSLYSITKISKPKK